jgi:cytoskeletal protein RodZ
MPAPSFGERLKREREMRGVSIEEVAKATRIGPPYIEALEAEQWSSLPGRAFNRGFIRSIARYLGMDEESILAEYALATKDIPEAPARDWQPIKLSTRWPKWVWYATVAVLVLLIGLCSWIVYKNRNAAKHSRLQACPSGYHGMSGFAAENREGWRTRSRPKLKI